MSENLHGNSNPQSRDETRPYPENLNGDETVPMSPEQYAQLYREILDEGTGASSSAEAPAPSAPSISAGEQISASESISSARDSESPSYASAEDDFYDEPTVVASPAMIRSLDPYAGSAPAPAPEALAPAPAPAVPPQAAVPPRAVPQASAPTPGYAPAGSGYAPAPGYAAPAPQAPYQAQPGYQPQAAYPAPGYQGGYGAQPGMYNPVYAQQGADLAKSSRTFGILAIVFGALGGSIVLAGLFNWLAYSKAEEAERLGYRGDNGKTMGRIGMLLCGVWLLIWFAIWALAKAAV